MNYLLDTDHLSVLQIGRGVEFSRLSNRIAVQRSLGDDVYLSVVSFHEQTLGAHNYINRARTPADLVRGYDMLYQIIQAFRQSPVIQFDANAAAIYGPLLVQHRHIGRMDLRIAASALAHSMTILTRNRGDFVGIARLSIDDWIT